MYSHISLNIKQIWKNFNLSRIAWLQRRGSVYFPFWDMVFKYPPLMLFNALVIIKSNLFKTCVIHTIGDSHVKPFIYRFPFLVHHISQATAYNLIKEKSFSRSGEYLELFLKKVNKKRDVVFLVFGEIDARVHIYLKYGQSGRTKSFDELIDETVRRYGQAIMKIRDQGIAVSVHGIPPAAKKDFITALPFSGKPHERSEISRKFNHALREYCRSVDIPYVDIQSIASDENGFIKKYYLADEVHCNSRIVPFCRSTLKEAFCRSKRI